MKKIGILFGQENTFPQAFVNRVNEKNVDGIVAEFVNIDKVIQGEYCGYDVIFDRISQDVPFKHEALKFCPLALFVKVKNANTIIEINNDFFMIFIFLILFYV